MAWYDGAVFYQIHPLSLCGCEQESAETEGSHFAELAEWAVHAKKMGCNAIYIGPVFKADTHGNGIIDYHKVDSRLGTNQEFKIWVAKCHSIGLRVVADAVFNHVGRGFFAFQNLKRNKKTSPYKEWFCNLNFSSDSDYGDGFSYESWGGYKRLVKLNIQNPWLVDYHFDTVRFWINEFDIDGIRIDAVDEWDYDFIKDLRKAVTQVKPDFWLLGELTDGAYPIWVNDKMLHCAANNGLQRQLILAHNQGRYPLISNSIHDMSIQCPFVKLYTFVANHDVSYLYEKLNNLRHKQLITILQYTLYGIPALYCGCEFTTDKHTAVSEAENTRPARQPLKLADHQNAYQQDEITRLHGLLGRANQKFPELLFGHYQELMVSEQQFVFARILRKKAVVVALNCGESPVHLEIQLPWDVTEAIDVLDAEIDWEEEPKAGLDLSGCSKFTVKDHVLPIELEANSGKLIRLTG